MEGEDGVRHRPPPLHRPECQRHYVLEHGDIRERGDHADLLRQRGIYYQLYNGMFELS